MCIRDRSHTTRKPRPNEIDGLDYHFVTKEKFQNMIDKKEFTNTQKYLIIIMALQNSQLGKLLERVKMFYLILIGRVLNS